MNITIQQSNQVTERNVPASIIHCLYNLGLDPNIDLSGAILLTGGVYVDEIEAVLSWYQNLYITADKLYIRFADPVVEQIVINWASSDGVGVDLSDVQRPLAMLSRFKSTSITSFDEFIYFTGVLSLPSLAFYNCKSLKSIGIPPGILNSSFGSNSFQGCTQLKKVHMRSIEDFCKMGSTSSSPNTPFYYGADLYVNGVKITDLVIPDNITTIGLYCFYKCSWMQSVTVHEDFNSFGSSAFSQCTGLTKVYTPDLSTWLRITFSDANSNPLAQAKHLYVGDTEVTDLTIPNDITVIKPYAFYNCAEITSVTIPNTVENIGSGAFIGCNGITAVYISDLEKYCNYNAGFPANHHIYLNGDEIINLTIPSGVTNIGSAFSYSSYINSVTIPNTVTSIGNSAFSSCTSLNSVTIPPSVTSINNAAFSNCTQLNSIYISDLSAWFKMDITSNNNLPGTKRIYLNGTEIINLTIPNDIVNILRHACLGWAHITQLTIPNSVTSIGTYAFSQCNGLTSVTIPSSISTIGNYAFNSCANLASVTIEGNPTNASNAFASCKKLTSATFLNGATIVDAYMFTNCEKLTNVTLPNSITDIRRCAFNSCKNLGSITLPSSVTNIGNSAFESCSLLREVISEATVPPTTDSTIFRYCPNSLIIYVPAESVNAYKAASGWSSYASKIQAIPSNP